MKATRITLVTSSLTCGGAEKNVALLANAWAKQGKAVTVISFDRHPPFFELSKQVRLISTDITRGYRKLWKDFWTTPSRIWKLRQTIHETQPDVVISFMDINNLLTLLSTVGTVHPIIVAERSDPSIWPTQMGWRALRQILYPRATRVITQTQGAKLYFPGFLQSKVIPIPNPVLALSQEISKTSTSPNKRIVSVGRLVRMKRYDRLVRAMGELRTEFPDWSLEIVGDGEEREHLKGLTQQLGLSNSVHWHGTLKNPETILQDASLFVLCSDFEGFPNALAEAMAAGVPSISTDTQGGRHLIRDHVNGILIPTGDPVKLKDAMRELMNNEELRSRLGRNALKVTEDYSLPKVLALWDSVLESV